MKARQKCHPGAFRTSEPRSPLPYKQDTDLFQPRTPVQSRLELRPGAFGITTARQGRIVPSHFGPFSQIRESVRRPATSSLTRHHPACSSPFLPCHPPGQPLRLTPWTLLLQPFACSTRRCPGKEGFGCFATVTASRGCPRSVAAGWAGAGPHCCCCRYKFGLAGGRWLPLLGAGLVCRQEESNRPLCKGGKKVVLSSASLQSPLLQALLLRGGGGGV